MSNDDRLAEIKSLVANPYFGHTEFLEFEDAEWLIAEVERLRDESRLYQVQAAQYQRPEYWEQIADSRRRMDAAIAAGVLEVSDAKSIFEREELRRENARCRALISWIDGMCLDNQPNLDTEIRAAINRYWQEQKP